MLIDNIEIAVQQKNEAGLQLDEKLNVLADLCRPHHKRGESGKIVVCLKS